MALGKRRQCNVHDHEHVRAQSIFHAMDKHKTMRDADVVGGSCRMGCIFLIFENKEI